MRLYVDFDDVLCQTARGLMDRVNAVFGKQLVFDQIKSFDLEDSFGLAREEWEWLNRQFLDPEVLLAFDPIPGAADVLRLWRERGGEIDIVTGRPPATLPPSLAWLDRHDMPCDRVLFVDKYGRGFTDAPGAVIVSMEEVARTDYHAAIDDSAEMIAYLSACSAYPLLLMDRPWNRALPAGVEPRVTRLTGWDDISMVLWMEVTDDPA